MVQNQSKIKLSVKNSFEKIAKDWNRLRGDPWPILLDFFKTYDYAEHFSNGILLDLGCGNGRHALLYAAENIKVIGVDFSFELLKIARRRCEEGHINNIDYVMADFTALPFRKSVVSSIFFLATFHHIPKQENRLKTLKEIEEVLQYNGFCLISIWRKWQKRFLRHFFKEGLEKMVTLKRMKEFGDIFIPWKQQDGTEIQRFYHLFSQREIKKLVQNTKFQIKLIKNFGGPTRKDNIFVVLKKIGAIIIP